MNVLDLIKELEGLRDEGHGELPVRLECDHGQAAMGCTFASHGYIDSYEYVAESVHPDDVTEDSKPVVLLEGY